MSNLNHLLHLQHVPPSAALLATRALTEGRGEWEKMLSLVEAGLAEAEEAEATGGTESPAWRRAVNIGKVIRDMAAANVARVRVAERKVSLLAMIEQGRLRKAGDDDVDMDCGDVS